MRFLKNILLLAPIVSSALAVTTAHLATKVSDHEERLIITLDRSEPLLKDNALVAQRYSSVVYEYDLSSVDDTTATINAPIRLDPSETSEVKTVYKILDFESQLESLKDFVDDAVELRADIALGVSPSGSSRDVALVMIVNTIRGSDLVDRELLQAKITVSPTGFVSDIEVLGGNIGVTVAESNVLSCDGNNRYWCELISLVNDARARAQRMTTNLITSVSSSAAVQNTEEESGHAGRRGKSGCGYRNRGHGKHYGSRHHSYHRHHESAASLTNGALNAMFNVLVPLLIGILTGSIVVLIAVAFADMVGSFIRSEDTQATFLIPDGQRISFDDFTEYMENRARHREVNEEERVDEKISFDEDGSDMESHPLL
ncbi:hypothetical protein V1512DRAFT_274464 [Lipomyces arxii]|uniref:uncharacterized protein n=1 Tax=Lipomyces arxii TaxID=56418 RepID=UPI0034CF6F9E